MAREADCSDARRDFAVNLSNMVIVCSSCVVLPRVFFPLIFTANRETDHRVVLASSETVLNCHYTPILPRTGPRKKDYLDRNFRFSDSA